jgi:cbb3-type cytochrome c oxidase subunit III
MLRYLKPVVAALDGVTLWPLISLGIFFVFFVVLLWRVSRMRREYVDELAHLPLEGPRRSALPVVLSTVVLADSAAVANAGKHFGMSDDAWIGILLVTALLLTSLILAAHGILRNLVEHRTELRRKLRMSGGGVLATTYFLSDGSFWAMVFAVSMLAVYLVLLVFQIRSYAADLRPRPERPAVPAEPVPEGPSWWARWATLLNAHVSMEKEDDLLLDHAFDGNIRELDNRLPPWWLYGFYLSIAFAAVYLVRYHVIHTAPLSAEVYELEMDAAEAARTAYLESMAANVDEATVVFDPSTARLAQGGALFATHCVSCHAPDGGGGVGPNLTDAYWLHGGTIGEVFKTVKYGVPSKGMKSWQAELSPVDMQNVSTYILSLQGTTPAAPKPPQGDLVVADTTSAAVAADSTSTP